MAKILQSDTDKTKIKYFCTGCQALHQVDAEAFGFDNNYDKPTIKKPIMVREGADTCHSVIVKGRIHYMGDCYHQYKNQIVEMEDIG